MGGAGDPASPPERYLRLVGLTPRELLDQPALACERSAIVAAYAVRVLNLDILSARVHLIDDSFIDVFANTAILLRARPRLR